MKSYRQVLLSRVPAGQRKTRDLVFFHRVHTLSALIQKLEQASPPPPPPPPPQTTRPVISVTTEGQGESAVFIVRGSGFVANSAVAIRAARIGDGQVHNVFFQTSATSDGRIETRLGIPCVSGLQLSFSANDGRSDPSDHTGTLWSNTVQSSCP
jgi:hypothetical protein